MLTNSAIFAAMDLAEQFDSAGVVLQPLAGWPLHHVVEATNASTDMAVKLESGEVSIDFWRLEQAANGKESNYDKSRHDYAMDDFISVASTSVQNALTVARTGAAPRISELMELVTMRLSNAPLSDLSRITVTEEEDCPALYGPNFRKLVDTYANYTNKEPILSINAVELSVPEILKMVETGVASIDAELMPWAAGLSEYTLLSAFERFFTFKYGATDTRGFFGRIDKSPIFMTLVYCISRHLIENNLVLDGVSSGLPEYRSALKEIMAQSAHMLAIQMDKNDSAIKNGSMIRSVIGNDIRVFAPVYRAWLEQGGDNDVLYGMSVSNKPKFTVAAITDSTEEYLRAWRGYTTIAASRDSSQRFNYLRQQLALAYESILNKPNDEGATPNPIAVKTEMDRFRDLLKAIAIKDADDLHYLCRMLVCRTSYPDSPAEMILAKMDEEAKRNPSLTPREAGAMATLWYISSWVAEMIVATSANK